MDRIESNINRYLLLALGVLCLLSGRAWSDNGAPGDFLTRLDRYPHAERVDQSQREVLDHVIGLGPMQKVRGRWLLEESARVSGQLTSYTWRIVDGFTSTELFDEIANHLPGYDNLQVLFECERRSCGRSVQWANRVFNQRVLYGTEESQRYRVYAFEYQGQAFRLVVYASARTADRHYLHVELVAMNDASEVEL
jgi:hypothetical protein